MSKEPQQHDRQSTNDCLHSSCSSCRFSMPLESRYDQVRCCNDASKEAWGEVEATHVCPLFELLTCAESELAAMPGSGSAGAERDILVTVYIYDLGSKAVTADLGHVMRDLDCSYFAPCELKQRFFSIGTDARATDEQCVERFIAGLKATGLDIGKHEWSTLPNDKIQP